MTTTKQPKKHLYLVTYLIALVCLILGLVLPCFKDADGESTMLLLMLPSALGNVFGIDSLADVGTKFSQACDVNFFGLFTLDINSLAICVYAIATVVGIVLLIPMFISKKKTVSVVASSVIEDISVVALFIYILNTVCVYGEASGWYNYFKEAFPFDWCVIALAFGGTLLMLIIQSIKNYKGSGVSKLIIMILALAAVFVVLPLTYVLPNMGNFKDLFVILSNNEYGISGYGLVNHFVQTAFADGGSLTLLGTATIAKVIEIVLSLGIMLVILNAIIELICLSTKSNGVGHKFTIIRYGLELALLAVGLVLVLITSGIKPGKFLYIITVLALVSFVICLGRGVSYTKKYSPKSAVKPAKIFTDEEEIVRPEPAPAYEVPEEGAYGYYPPQQPAGATANVYISFGGNPYAQVQGNEYNAPAPEPAYMNDMHRCPPPPAPYAPYPYYPAMMPPMPMYQAMPAPAAMPAYTTPAPAPVAPAPVAAPAPAAAPAEAPAPAAEAPVYKPAKTNRVTGVIYGGPMDDFISTLSEDEKVEFARTFIEKIDGDFEDVPDYAVGGDNRDFFSAVFIHLNVFRDKLSDGLLEKIYNELG